VAHDHPPAVPRVDPVVGRVTESRLGRGAFDRGASDRGDASPPGELAKWGGTPAAPVCGPAWLGRYTYEAATLSKP
jgi:hypothetical protein